MQAEISLSRNIFAFIVLAGLFGLPTFSVADHVPDNLSQDLDPNYIACLMAVDDAKTEFRDALQSTCLERMANLCSGMNGHALPSQVIGCLNFETQRGIRFLKVAANDLPASVEKEGLFGHGYERRRSSILEDVETLENSPKPQDIDAAVQQSIIMSLAATTLFWLARETQTSMESHVKASFGRH